MIAFCDEAGIVTLLPLDLRFGFEDALQQDGIFGHHTPLHDLQDLDQSALLGEFVFPGRQLVRDDLVIVGPAQCSLEESRLGGRASAHRCREDGGE